MNLQETKLKLERNGISTSIFDEYFKTYSSKHQQANWSISKKQLKGCLEALSYFRPYFSQDEYGKLVCKKIISFMYIHSFYISSESIHKELNIRTFATPNSGFIPHLEVACSKAGYPKISHTFGVMPQLISV